MSKIIAAAVAALFVIGPAGAMAQNTPQDKAPEQAPKGPASSGAVKNERPTSSSIEVGADGPRVGRRRRGDAGKPVERADRGTRNR